jgi:hypothetical protein
MMTRHARLFLAVTALWVLGGCSNIKVWTETDPTASFEGLRTYTWAEVSQSIENDPHEENPILDRRIRLAVETELSGRGFEKVEEGTPDFFIGYHAAAQQQLDVRYVDDYYAYAYTYRARPPRRTVYVYERGTLVLDVSLPEPKRLIWRAIASAEISPDESQEQGDKRLAEAVRKMFDKFPAEGPVPPGETGRVRDSTDERDR